MKKFITTIATALLLFAALAVQAQNDTVRLKVAADPTATKAFYVTVNGNFTVHWGDRNSWNYSGGSVYLSYDYDLAGEYVIMIVGDNTSKILSLESTPSLKVLELDLTKAPNLTNLECISQPNLKSLDLSKNKLLTYVNVSENTALTSLNISGLTELVNLHAHSCRLSQIDLRGMAKLNDCDVSYNVVSDILFDAHTFVQNLYAYNNALSFSKMRETNRFAQNSDLWNQILPHRSVSANIAINLSGDTIVVGSNNTEFYIYDIFWNDLDTALYTLSGNLITFKKEGLYWVDLYNSGFPSVVTIPFVVGNNLPLQEIRFSTSADEFIGYIDKGGSRAVAVNWGDGQIDTLFSPYSTIELKHTFRGGPSERNVVISGLTPDFAFWSVYFNDNSLTSLNLTKAPTVSVLEIAGNNLKTLDLSQQLYIWTLYASENPELERVVFHDSIDMVFNIYLDGCALSLQELRRIQTTVNYSSFDFSNQTLPMRPTEIGKGNRFSGDMIFVSGAPSSFSILRSGGFSTTENVDYRIVDDSIFFLKSDIYTMQMSHSSVSGTVAIPYNVGNITKESISFTIDEGDWAGFSMNTTGSDWITVDWGNGDVGDYWHGGWTEHYYGGDLKNYTITVTVNTLGSGITEFSPSGDLIAVDVTRAPSLEYLNLNWCENISSIDLSNNPKLEELYLQGNRLTSLDVSNNPNLGILYAIRNQITTIDVSKNTKLKDLRLNHNLLTTLDISKNPELEHLKAHSNKLTLKEVYRLSTIIPDADDNLFIFPQNLDFRTVAVGTSASLAADTIIIKGAPTQIGVRYLKGDTARQGTDYTLTGNAVTFLKDGFYEVTLWHDSIAAYERNHWKQGHYVSIPFMVGTVPAQQEIRFTHETTYLEFYLETSDNAHYTVDFGDGRIDTVSQSSYKNFGHGYNQAGTYEVVIKGLSPTVFFLDLFAGNSYVRNNITAIDISKAPVLNTLRLNHNRLNTINISQNRSLRGLKIHNNQFSLKDIHRLSLIFLVDPTGDGGGDNGLFALPQTLPIREVNLNTPVRLNNDTIILNGKATTIQVLHQNLTTAQHGVDYTLSGDALYFLNAGLYRVRLSHDDLAVVDRGSSNNYVEIPFLAINDTWEQIKVTAENTYYYQFDVRYTGTLYVNLGNGEVRTFTGGSNLFWGDYSSAGTYEITLSAATITQFYNYTWATTALDVSKAPSLRVIGNEWKPNFSSIDVSQNTNLEILYISGNQLTTLDVSKNTKLKYLILEGNMLTTLNVSQNTDLEGLNVARNQLTTIDVSKNAKLEELGVSYNQLTTIDISQNPELYDMEAYNNKLSLKEVYKLSTIIPDAEHNLGIFPQMLNLRTATIGTGMPLAADTIVVGGKPTQIGVRFFLGDTAVPGVDYNLSGTTVTFLKNGFYEVILQHDSIEGWSEMGDGDYVSIPFAVGSITPNQITLTWEAKANETKSLEIHTLFGSHSRVNWGDGQIDTLPSNNWNWHEHIYKQAGTYTVTLNTLSLTSVFEYLYVDDADQRITAIDITQAPFLRDLYLFDNKLTSIDMSKNPLLRSLDLGWNQLTDIISGTTKYNDMDWFRANRNQLSLKTMYRLSEAFSKNSNDYRFGRQVLDERLVVNNRVVDLSADTILVNGDPTRIRVWKDKNLVDPTMGWTGSYASAAEYQISGDKITFLRNGEYQVELFHDSIRYSGSLASVFIPFTVEFSGDGTLRTLAVNGTSVALEAGKFDYAVFVNNSVASAAVTATVNDADAIILSGLGSFPLEVGSNFDTIVVRAQSGDEVRYYLNVIRRSADPSTNANLRALAVSVGTLTPVFDSMVTNYTVTVADTVANITITATTSHELAGVSGDGTHSLNTGSNTFPIVVTAESGAIKVYTIVVTRSSTNILDIENHPIISVYPNPVVDVLYIQTAEQHIPEVRVFNLGGTLIIHAHTTELNVSNLPNGMYLVWVDGRLFRVVKN